jgi:HAD superfamily hydrolase (TIGR01549 family)
MKSSYANYIFDFDGTIAKLIIDWQECKNLVNKHCSKNNIANDLSLSQKIVELGQISEHYLDVIYKLETCNGKLNYCLIKPTINFIKSLEQEIYIISNNHSQTIVDILSKEGLIDNCKKIIGIDNVTFSKPNNEAFKKIKPYINLGSSLYIGDKETDQQFAKECNLDFIYVNKIIA